MNRQQPTIDQRYRTMLILFFALCMSVVMWLVLTLVKPVEPAENRNLALALIGLSLVPVSMSYLLKLKLLHRAAENRNLMGVQQAYVLAWALCEVPALLGVVTHFATGSALYLLYFGLAGVGLLSHFPLKKHLLAASGQEF